MDCTAPAFSPFIHLRDDLIQSTPDSGQSPLPEPLYNAYTALSNDVLMPSQSLGPRRRIDLPNRPHLIRLMGVPLCTVLTRLR